MHDLTSAHLLDRERDTEVVDVPEEWHPPLEAQVVMHVQLLYGDGKEHRLMPGHDALSCESDELDHTRVIIKPAKLDGTNYCDVCFTPAERDRALREVAKRRNDADGFVGISPLTPSRRRTRGYTVTPKTGK